MDEYRVDVKVRNNLLLSAIEKAGYKTVAEFCRACDMEQVVVGNYLNLKLAPLRRDGEFRNSAQKLLDFFGALPEDLWTAEQLTMELATNSTYFSVEQRQLAALIDRTATGRIEHDEPEKAIERKELQQKVQALLNESMNQTQKHVLLGRADGKTLADIATELDLTSERVRQIEKRAIHRFQRLFERYEVRQIEKRAIHRLQRSFERQEENGTTTTNGFQNGIQP